MAKLLSRCLVFNVFICLCVCMMGTNECLHKPEEGEEGTRFPVAGGTCSTQGDESPDMGTGNRT